ncbi:unnamed protein product [Echinostoma caproni]|uniref:Uncharacterized protein n=1 Tax=Echinostoma caproni TaxID=27848 RepID=A0A183AV78_9TREM|nr:unnamed protein product [Echinostoma caproni]
MLKLKHSVTIRTVCPPGFHPAEFFQCAKWDPQIDAISNPGPRIRWAENLSRVKKPMERWRPWVYDSSGLRLLGWDKSEADCAPPKLGNFEYKSVCLTEPTPLTRYFSDLDNLNALHPRFLLEHYVYRDPDEYLTKEETGKIACTLGCDCRPFQELKPMSQREVMRMRFATNNYRTFDDWIEDSNDQFLQGLLNKDGTVCSSSK